MPEESHMILAWRGPSLKGPDKIVVYQVGTSALKKVVVDPAWERWWVQLGQDARSMLGNLLLSAAARTSSRAAPLGSTVHN
jgi:hypothetical protein